MSDTRERVVRRIVAEIDAGLRHGYFEYTLTCEVVSRGTRRVLLRAGKHYRFLIEADECETGTRLADPHQEGANQSNE